MAENLATSSSTEVKKKLSETAERLCRQFSLAEIRLATDGFDDARLVGVGGFVKVYRGLIDKGRETVAIKRLETSSNQGAAEFCAEIETLTKLRHINLVSLIGYCHEHEEMILVYEYIAHGTLADHLYKLSRNKDRDESSSLTWKQRLKICIGAGRGLDYLHTGSSIIHRDVKSTNILLDENFIAKVSDFGLAKHLSASNSQSHVSTIVKGSFGYLDPSYFGTGRLTRKSDIYAFGVVLLEVLCGRPAVDPRLAEDEMSLSIWAREKISKGKVDQIVASNLREEILADCLKIFVGVTKKCLHLVPKKRPTMAQAVVQLEYALEQQDREAATYNALRFLPLNAFWSRVKPSGNRATGTTENDPKQADIKILSVAAVPATPEEALKDKHTVNMLPVANPAISVDESEEKISVNVLPIVVPAIPLYELKDITNNFSFRSLIGGVLKLGSVYSGVLKNGQAVAIKTLDYSRQSDMEFLTQVSIISSLKHENMTQLLGYCVDGARQLLAYEFAPSGSLHDILHERKAARGSEQSPALTWMQRVKIALGAAKGLEYIHEKGQLHLNIKSSNILIFNGEVAKIADFGLPSEAPNGGLPWYEDVSHNQPPELIRKSDTYAFGVVLLEVLCGRPAVDPRLAEDEMSLVMWAREKISEGKVDEIVASKLRLEISADSLKTFVGVAKRCLDLEPEKRPTMGKVAVRLLLALKQQLTHNASRFFALLNRGNHATGSDYNQVDASTLSTGGPPTKEDASMEKPIGNIPFIPLGDLKEITGNSSSNNLIGEGSNGSVFYGVLKSGQAAAVKELNHENQPNKKFLEQVEISHDLKHENVARLLGFRVDGGLQFLAYEFAPNGSLNDILHRQLGVNRSKPGPALSWAQRVKIAVGAARGLKYIHDKGQVHGNIKSSNILVFDDEVAKIAGFGKPIQSSNKNGHDLYHDFHPSVFRYPRGHHPPEYVWSGALSWKTDVYSFGVVLLELLTGRELLDRRRPIEQEHLVMWAAPWLGSDRISEIVDARLNGDYPPKAVVKMAEIAGLCVQDKYDSRPDMTTVVRDLAFLQTLKYDFAFKFFMY